MMRSRVGHALLAATGYLCAAALGAHQSELSSPGQVAGRDFFLDVIFLAGMRVELQRRRRFVGGGASHGPGVIYERIVAARFHLDALLTASDHWRDRSAVKIVRPIEIDHAFRDWDGQWLITLTLHAACAGRESKQISRHHAWSLSRSRCAMKTRSFAQVTRVRTQRRGCRLEDA